MAQIPGQLGWDFDHFDQDTPLGPMAPLSSVARPAEGSRPTGRGARTGTQSQGQQQAAIARRAERTAVAGRRSVLAERDWTGTYCLRCEHACSGRHHPGAFGPYKALGCACVYCLVRCACSHDSADHEPYGDETSSGCKLCDCNNFSPVRPVAR